MLHPRSRTSFSTTKLYLFKYGLLYTDKLIEYDRPGRFGKNEFPNRERKGKERKGREGKSKAGREYN